jgi:hypothetical protein
MRVLVCGGRDYTGYEKLKKTLYPYVDKARSTQSQITFIQGEAKGADFLCKVFALDELVYHDGLILESYPADWKKYGKAAGGIRNQQMLDEGKPDIVVAFPGGSGTADMVRRARKAGVEVIEVE